MRDRVLPLRRIRVELERTWRAHPFVGRAIRGNLAGPPYARLITGLSDLLGGVSAELASDLSARAASDLRELGLRTSEPVCGIENHFGTAVRGYVPCLALPQAFDASLAVLGTSWTIDAARQLGRRHPGATAFLERLGAEGPRGLSRLSEAIEREGVDLLHLYGFAELARGTLLGLAAYLDSRWPDPVIATRLVFSRSNQPKETSP